MIGPSFIEVEGMPIKIRTDADENRADVMTAAGQRTHESGDRRLSRRSSSITPTGSRPDPPGAGRRAVREGPRIRSTDPTQDVGPALHHPIDQTARSLG